jgi:hypothetical protein
MLLHLFSYRSRQGDYATTGQQAKRQAGRLTGPELAVGANLYQAADNSYQAVEDLSWDWSRVRRQAWAIDTGTPETQGRHAIEIEANKRAPG